MNKTGRLTVRLKTMKWSCLTKNNGKITARLPRGESVGTFRLVKMPRLTAKTHFLPYWHSRNTMTQ